MPAFSLGLAWLVLGPLSLWVLVRGRNPARLGALLTVAALEVATITTEAHSPLEVVAHDMPSVPDQAVCAERRPVPESARLDGRHDGLALSWPAAPGECATARVVVRHDGRRLRVWVREGPPEGEHRGEPYVGHGEARPAGAPRTLPVRVEHGAASLVVPLDGGSHYVPVDGRTGRRIPSEGRDVAARHEALLARPGAMPGPGHDGAARP
ncbi:hypothetical protein [Nonomuraea sp. NPDC048916]|uniref:hypothetical protein n=1 Tax=Nonomuraea sp. NPDC048916 TaxID=3154232 RepID=UPI0033FB56F2